MEDVLNLANDSIENYHQCLTMVKEYCKYMKTVACETKSCNCKYPSIQMIPLKIGNIKVFDYICSNFPNEYLTYCEHGIDLLRFKHLENMKRELLLQRS